MTEPRASCEHTMEVYRLTAGELSKADAEKLEAHVAECADCTKTKAELSGAQAELMRAMPADRIWNEPRAKPREPSRWGPLAAMAAAAAIASFILIPRGDLRPKGSLDAHLVVERGGQQLNGVTSFCPNDRLQPVLRTTAAGTAFVFWLENGETKLLGSHPVKAGEETVYPQSFALDEQAKRAASEASGDGWAGSARPGPKDAHSTERLLIVVTDRPEAEVVEAVRRGERIGAAASWPIDKSCR